MKKLREKLQEQFDLMQKTGKLFTVAVTGQQVWEIYLNSFKKENDPQFRDPESSQHNCNHCKNFIRRYGNIVAIAPDFTIMSIFDIENVDLEYKDSIEAMRNIIRSTPINEVFFETFNELNSLPYETCKNTNSVFQLGVKSNPKRYTKEEADKFGVVKENEIRTFEHFSLKLDKEYVDQTGASIESIRGSYRDAYEVFKRGMETISMDTLVLVKDLINQGSLLNGDAHLKKIETMIPLKKSYGDLTSDKKSNWCWITSYKFPLAKFRNELIGVLCSELSEGEEINKACQSWNKRVDPANYMKVTAPITKKQIEEAAKFVEENGYTESFDRRFATMDDIKASEILHSNVGDAKIKPVSMFDSVKSTSTQHKRSEYDGLEEVPIDKFMKNILPGCTSIEVLLENRFTNHMVSLTTANVKESKPIFKWPNNYSWTFNGDLAGMSQIKQAVKAAGGSNGVLNFRLGWNEDGSDHSDLDAWCGQPDGRNIGFSTGYRKDMNNMFSTLGGQLDVDDRGGSSGLHVENIYFMDLNKMKDGIYSFWVDQYSTRGSKGFKAEIEFNGEIHTYVWPSALRTGQDIKVAEVTLKNGKFTINHFITVDSGFGTPKDLYGLQTNQFYKVNLMCLSPNHWNDNQVGNKHYFFMLENCKAPESIRSFHNENLIPEIAAHRKVLEVLGAQNKIQSTDKQLSGLGFNSTVKDHLIVKLQGTHKRMIKITFP